MNQLFWETRFKKRLASSQQKPTSQVASMEWNMLLRFSYTFPCFGSPLLHRKSSTPKQKASKATKEDLKRQETQTKTTISFSLDFWSMATGSSTNVKPGFKWERVLRQIGHVILEPSKLNGRGEGTSLLDMHARWPQWATRCRHKQATFVLCGVTRLYGPFIPSFKQVECLYSIPLIVGGITVSGWLWEILEEADEARCLRTLSLEFGIDSSSIPLQN